jgi:prophage antirepressor-like protein
MAFAAYKKKKIENRSPNHDLKSTIYFIKMNNNKITKYSYVDDNSEEKEYFIASEITSLIGYKNVTQFIKNVSEENKIFFKNYLGVKEPKIYASQILINKDGIYEILNKTKNTLSEETLNIFKAIARN